MSRKNFQSNRSDSGSSQARSKDTRSNAKSSIKPNAALSSGTRSFSGTRPARSDDSKVRFSYPKSWRQVAGTHAINELVRVRAKSIKAVLLQRNWASSADLRELVENLKNCKIQFEEKSEQDLQKICPSHQGVVAFSDFTPSFDYENAGWEEQSLIVALDGVEDPHNLGAILRTSWLMQVSGVIVPVDRAVGLTATVHKVACGGVEHVPVAQINNFSDPFSKLKEAGFWVFGLSHKATQTIYDLKIPEKVIWVMGAEDKGLRVPTERACDELVSIPQSSAMASYNVSVATAIALAETKRQWKMKSGNKT